MSIFSSFKNQDVKIETVKENVGGGVKFGVVDTDIYTATIKQAYVSTYKGGAMAINLELLTDSGNLIRNQQWVTSGTAKGCKNYYVDKNGKNQYLPGYNLINDICVLAADTELSDVDTEERAVQVYDFKQRKQVSKPHQVIVDLLGQKITLAIQKVIEDKNVNDGNGNYIASGETREINEIAKAFCAEDQVTLTEKKSGLTEASYLNSWKERNKGNVVNKSKGTSVPAAPVAPAASIGQSAPAESAPAAPKSLFG